METAILAGGCFWGMEDLIRKIPGVQKTRVGYTGGHFKNPTYKDVCTETTGHAEALEIVFDPSILPYSRLLQYFFQIHDPQQLIDREMILEIVIDPIFLRPRKNNGKKL